MQRNAHSLARPGCTQNKFFEFQKAAKRDHFKLVWAADPVQVTEFQDKTGELHNFCVDQEMGLKRMGWVQALLLVCYCLQVQPRDICYNTWLSIQKIPCICMGETNTDRMSRAVQVVTKKNRLATRKSYSLDEYLLILLDIAKEKKVTFLSGSRGFCLVFGCVFGSYLTWHWIILLDL